MMKLSQLFPNDKLTDPDLDVSSVTADSRAVTKGGLFAALPGAKTHGVDFIQQALDAGATVILAPVGTQLPQGSTATLITATEPRKVFAEVASRFFRQSPTMMVAVTGTNGKTSVAHFTRLFFAEAGHKAASMGTLGIVAPHLTRAGSLTTPDTVSLHRDLAMLAQNSITHVALEASSHGLAQYRLHGLHLRAAAFTNLSRDHLDYHGTMDDYFDAKAKLFSEVLPTDGIAVLNADVPEYAKLVQILNARKIPHISYGEKGDTFKLKKFTPVQNGAQIELDIAGTTHNVNLPLIGRFQTDNVLCAAALAFASGVTLDKILQTLPKLATVRGRLEYAGTTAAGAAIYVDYAHTPDGLETALKALRPHTHNKLHVVFGCGGDRDRGKRPLMGEIAGRLADVAIVTDDNPRSENPATIRAEVLAGFKQATEIGDRRAAIGHAIEHAGAGDIILIAGKGHEQGQIVGKDILPFDDVRVAREWLVVDPSATSAKKAGGHKP